MAERKRASQRPTRQAVKDLAATLNEVDGPEWVDWQVGTIPGFDVPMLTKFARNASGRYVLTGLMLLGGPITADQIRKVPVSALENAHNLGDFGSEGYERIHAELAELPPLERGTLTSEQFSQLVAEHYKAWARHVPHPAVEMAGRWRVKPPTMASWIREARLRGFLPAGQRRKGFAS